MTTLFRTILFLICSAFTLPALASDNPFAARHGSATWMAAGDAKGSTDKCMGMAAPKEGAMSTSDAEMKALCAAKIRGGFCGAGKCATGKCGDTFKENCAKMMEGKKKCGGM
jgi:hypothetical protein